MKTKNIFLTAISALFIFAACTEEKIIDEPGVSGKGDLVIELSPSSVITKAAATNEGYVYAIAGYSCSVKMKNILRLSIFLAMLYRKLRMNM